jgi:mono/diheme cytochrome c family protein
MKIIYYLISLSIFGLIVSCSKNSDEPKVDGRWYTQSQITFGEKIFQNNCAVCHGNNAQGTFNWKKSLADGSYPPPPLNGSAHTWHHPMAMLKRTIEKGGIALGGKMPAFQDKLSDEEIEAVIAYFQNKWNSEIYEIWKSKVNK